MDRRKFLNLAGITAASAALAPSKSEASLNLENQEESPEFVGVLVDTTKCIGCRQCEIACAEAHDLPVPTPATDGALEKHRDTSTD